MRTLILGASGMLGNATFRAIHGTPGQTVVGTVRSSAALGHFGRDERSDLLANVDVLDNDTLVNLLTTYSPDVIVNCVGLIKQLSNADDPLVALPVNALFPHKLARLAALAGARVVHISTDCVFTGKIGDYSEEDAADARDLYGVSKHLGELVDYKNAVTLRTSIIGRELISNNSLLDWFLAQRDPINGYRRAIFSGLPTNELAAVIRDLVIPRQDLCGLYHVSAEPISKFDLLTLIAAEYDKEIVIRPDDKVVIDRSLNSRRFSLATGYIANSWPELIKRMRDADFRGVEKNV